VVAELLTNVTLLPIRYIESETVGRIKSPPNPANVMTELSPNNKGGTAVVGVGRINTPEELKMYALVPDATLITISERLALEFITVSNGPAKDKVQDAAATVEEPPNKTLPLPVMLIDALYRWMFVIPESEKRVATVNGLLVPRMKKPLYVGAITNFWIELAADVVQLSDAVRRSALSPELGAVPSVQFAFVSNFPVVAKFFCGNAPHAAAVASKISQMIFFIPL
jgi:hypothetical protein